MWHFNEHVSPQSFAKDIYYDWTVLSDGDMLFPLQEEKVILAFEPPPDEKISLVWKCISDFTPLSSVLIWLEFIQMMHLDTN